MGGSVVRPDHRKAGAPDAPFDVLDDVQVKDINLGDPDPVKPFFVALKHKLGVHVRRVDHISHRRRRIRHAVDVVEVEEHRRPWLLETLWGIRPTRLHEY